MKYLIDTCVISDLVKRRYQVAEKLFSISPDSISVSSVTLMEIEYGLLLDREREKKLRPKLQDFFETVHLLAFERGDARAAAKIRSDLKGRGTPIGPYDALLAGTALHRELIFVTSNEKEFSRISSLTLENWRS